MNTPTCAECIAVGACPVVPSGNTRRPPLAIVGEAPGEVEMDDGVPFVGKAGSLLRRALTEAGIPQADCYYDNAIMRLDPSGRKPRPKEIAECNPRLMANLEAVDPSMILALGNFGMSAVLGVKPTGILKERGRTHIIEINQREYMVALTVHPSYVLRVPDAWDEFLADLVSIRNSLRGEAGGMGEAVPPPFDDYVMIDTQAGFDALLRRLETVEAMAVDLETVGVYPQSPDGHILSIGLSWKRGTGVCVDWQALLDTGGTHPLAERNVSALAEAFRRIRTAYHNGQFDVHWLLSRGIEPDYRMDTMLAHYVTDERTGTHALKDISASRYAATPYDEELKALLRERKTLGRSIRPEPVPVPDDLLDYKPKPREAKEDDRKAPLAMSLDTWIDEPSRHAVMRYNAADADYTWRLTEDLARDMRTERTRRVHDQVMIPAARHFIRLEQHGVRVDTDYQDSLAREWVGELREVEADLRAFHGAGDLNFRSTDQMSSYLYETLDLDMMEARGEVLTTGEVFQAINSIPPSQMSEEAREYWSTASSAVFSKMKPTSTSTYMLHWLGHQHEFPRRMIRYRELMTMLQTYYYGWRAVMHGDRIHPRYRIHGTRTGRMSSTDPNVHGTARKKIIKDMLIADPGYTLIYMDYSQAEIRMLAHFSRDPLLMEACREDIHRAVSRTLFGVTDEDLDAMDPERRSFLRRAAKTIVFGIIYGRGATSLAPQMGTTVDEAMTYRDAFLRRMHRARRWIEEQKDMVMRLGYSETLQGFRRRYSLDMARRDREYASQVARYAVNQPIQGSVSMMTTHTNIRMHEIVDSWGVMTHPWPHTHDGFGIQVPNEVADDALDAMIRVAHDVPFETDVNFAVEVARGDRWGSVEEVYNG